MRTYQVRAATPSSSGTVGLCIHCPSVGKKEVVFKEDGIAVVEKYCDRFMEPKEFERLQSIYGRIG